MTPFAAVAYVSHALHALTGSGHHLTICQDCRDALLADLAGMCVPVAGRRAVSLEHSSLVGCTFSDGPEETCALHALLHEDDALCR